MSERRAILIGGPTASGKSQFALRLAQHLHAVIVNADSMQVYSEISILSGRPTREEENILPHDLYGHVPMAEAYSVGRFLKEMEGVLARRTAQGKNVIIVGGTGLYLKALLQGISPIPSIPVEIRTYWRTEAQKCGSQNLHQRLRERDPETAARLRSSDPQRIVRALEVLDATGLSLSAWQNVRSQPLLSSSHCIRLLLCPDRKELYTRSERRFDSMMQRGALQEAERIQSLSLDPSLPAMRALGLRPLLKYLKGELSHDDAVLEAKADTRHYIKRQLTWIVSNMITWNKISEQQMERNEAELISFINSLP